MAQAVSNGRTREVRIGLVMYGGVSLAIYMNGVANELFRAVRGRGVYGLFKALTDSDVVVDVVSGASAGGINGMFLGFALCNEVEFCECAELWRRQGDIENLLRKPDAPPESQTSLFDSEAYYEPQLAGAFRRMWRHPIDASQERGAPSPLEELDLFVAATDFNGRRSTSVDSAAHVIDVKDYRVKFWLKHRAHRKRQLDPRADALGQMHGDGAGPTDGAVAQADLETGFSALAKLARITSCFPAAFAPVSLEVPPRSSADGIESPALAVGRKLGVWGLLEPGQHYFLDGGILDNKPFTSTIQAIFYRMAHRPVQRHLLYVEPDPERFQNERLRIPDFSSSTLDSLTRLPSYESIAGDLQEIGKHNGSIERYERTCAELRDWVMNGAAPAGMPPRAAGRSARSDASRAIYERARLQSLADLVGQGLLDLEPGRRSDEGSRALLAQLRHALDEAMAQAGARACGSRAPAEDLFSRYDVEFRLRRLMHLTYVLMPAVGGPSAAAPPAAGTPLPPVAPRSTATPAVPTPAQLLEPDAARAALEGIGHRIALLEIVRAKLLGAIERGAPEWRKLDPDAVWGAVRSRLDAVLDVAGLPDDVLDALRGKRPCEALLGRLSATLDRRTAPSHPTPAQRSTSLLTLVDEGDAALLEGFEASPRAQPAAQVRPRRPVAHEYQHFEALDQVLFPMQFVADLRERDVIRTVRVSPLDAQRGCSKSELPERKVAGEALYHFAAFLKRSWRSNDILYGRLDGACQLLETLLNPSWLRTSLASPAQREHVLATFGVLESERAEQALRKAGLQRWLREHDTFPKAGEEAVAHVAEALAALLDPAPSDFESRIQGSAHGALLDALVEASHFSILQEDYATLIEDSIHEQLAWRTANVGVDAPGGTAPVATPAAGQSASSKQTPPLPRFDPRARAFDLPLDNLAVTAAAQQFATSALAGHDPKSLARLLREHPVGNENIRDHVPPGVLLELTARTLLVLRNCVLNSFGPERAAALREHRAYRVFVDWPLRSFYALARMIRERPAHGGMALALLAYVFLAALVDVFFFDALWALEGWRGALATLVFVALPLGSLSAAAALVAASEYSRNAVRSVYLALARRILVYLAVVVVALAALAPIYIAHAYLAEGVSLLLAPILCEIGWVPGSCTDAGSIVVLVSAAAVSFVIGRLTARRRAPPRATDADEQDAGGDGGPTSSASGAGPLPLPVRAATEG